MLAAPAPLFRENVHPLIWVVIFLSPAIEIVLVTAFSDQLGKIFFPGEPYRGLGVLSWNLVTAVALCVAVGIWTVNPLQPWSTRIAFGTLLGAGLTVPNASIAFAGCAILAS